MTRERACEGCGGTGRVAYHTSTAAQTRCAYHCTIDCPVCLGSGRVVDAITAQDAIADAETLERNVDSSANTSDEAYSLWIAIQESDLREWNGVWHDDDPSPSIIMDAVPALREE